MWEMPDMPFELFIDLPTNKQILPVVIGIAIVVVVGLIIAINIDAEYADTLHLIFALRMQNVFQFGDFGLYLTQRIRVTQVVCFHVRLNE